MYLFCINSSLYIMLILADTRNLHWFFVSIILPLGDAARLHADGCPTIRFGAVSTD